MPHTLFKLQMKQVSICQTSLHFYNQLSNCCTLYCDNYPKPSPSGLQNISYENIVVPDITKSAQPASDMDSTDMISTTPSTSRKRFLTVPVIEVVVGDDGIFQTAANSHYVSQLSPICNELGQPREIRKFANECLLKQAENTLKRSRTHVDSADKNDTVMIPIPLTDRSRVDRTSTMHHRARFKQKFKSDAHDWCESGDISRALRKKSVPFVPCSIRKNSGQNQILI